MRKKRRKTGTVKKTPVKRKKKVAKKKVLLPRPYNAGTQTNSMFWGMIRSSLRRLSMMRWVPTKEVRQKARIAYVGPNKKRKYSYVCEMCKREFDAKSTSVHHIIPCGTLTCATDLPDFITKLFCEKEFLMLICNKCHDEVHKEEKA